MRELYAKSMKKNTKSMKKNKELKESHGNGYHAVVKGRTDSLNSDELDIYRFMIGGMQGK